MRLGEAEMLPSFTHESVPINVGKCVLCVYMKCCGIPMEVSLVIDIFGSRADHRAEGGQVMPLI